MLQPFQRLASRAVDEYRQTVGLGAIALAAILWAIAAIVARRLFDAGVQPTELAAVRAVIAALGLTVIHQWQPASHRWRDWRIVALGLSLALVTVSYYVAIDRLSVAIAVVIQYTAPALVVMINAVRRRQRPAATTVFSAGLALLGVMLVSGVGTSALVVDGWGLLAAGLSALFFANNVLLSESMVGSYGAIGVVFRGFVVSSAVWVVVQLSQGVPTAMFQAETFPGVLFVGIGGTLIPFSLLCWGIQQVRAERGAIAATLEPVMAAALAWLWLGQTLTVMQLVGSGLVIFAVTLLQVGQSDRQS